MRLLIYSRLSDEQQPYPYIVIANYARIKPGLERKVSRFSDTLMEHFQSPANRRGMECADFVGTGSFDGYPPFVTLYLRVSGDRISDATFLAEGCGVTIACGSMLTTFIRGRNVVECREITPQDLSVALDGIPPGKEYCADVTIAALQDAIRGWH